MTLSQGVITGCNSNQEWLLSWWWQHYSAKNSAPVLFIDFGMSDEGCAWCKKRGRVVSIAQTLPVAGPEEVALERRGLWETHFGAAIWERRRAWFQKPLALKQAPFERSIWLDLDCEVRGPLDPLFDCLNLGVELVMKPEPSRIQEIYERLGFIQPGEVNYNSGVIVFRKDSTILQAWVKEVSQRSDGHPSDQEALSYVIWKKGACVLPLPELYNWNPLEGHRPSALILHRQGDFLKNELREKIKESFLGSECR